MKETIAKKLKELRGKKLQKEVASALEIKQNRYNSYENGIREPPLSILIKIKEYYNLDSIEYLFN